MNQQADMRKSRVNMMSRRNNNARGTVAHRNQTWVKGMRSSYNQRRFAELPPEAIYAEVILSEVQEFISALYGTLLRFYLPAVKYDELDDLTEELVELVTSLTINQTLSPWLLKLCRLSSREDELLLKEKLE